MTTLYAIRNRLTGGMLHKSLFRIRIFLTTEKAQAYMKNRRLNAEYFEVVKLVTGGQP
jgi:hypothetical protein